MQLTALLTQQKFNSLSAIAFEIIFNPEAIKILNHVLTVAISNSRNRQIAVSDLIASLTDPKCSDDLIY